MKRSETRELMSFFRHPTLGMMVRKERLFFTASLLTIPVEQDIPGKLLSSRACFRLPVRNEINLQSGNKKVLTFTQQKNCPAKLDHLRDTAKIANRSLEETIVELKQQSGQDILIGSRSLIIRLLNSNLIDEFQICIHPMVEGKGLKLFDQIKDRIIFKLIKTKSLNSGVTIFYYEPIREITTNR